MRPVPEDLDPHVPTPHRRRRALSLTTTMNLRLHEWRRRRLAPLRWDNNSGSFTADARQRREMPRASDRQGCCTESPAVQPGSRD